MIVTISETDPTGVTRRRDREQVAALTRVSREAADDSNRDVIMRNITGSIGLSIDAAAFPVYGLEQSACGAQEHERYRARQHDRDDQRLGVVEP